jgi:SAM-dependent methyltransferase
MAERWRSMKSMKLYDHVERILNELRARGISDNEPLQVDDLTPFDQFHYHGTEAVDEAIAVLKPSPEARLLEVGAGIGGPARYIADRTGCHVTALELQPDLHSIGAALSGRCALDTRVDHRQGDILDNPFDGADFDALISFLVFLHIEDRARLLEACRRALKPGGHIFIEDFSKRAEPSEAQWADLRHKVQCPYIPTPQTYCEQLIAAGFTPVSVTDMSEAWTDYTRERYEAFRIDRSRHQVVHGRAVAEGLEDFFRTIADLYGAGVLGGLRIVAARNH